MKKKNKKKIDSYCGGNFDEKAWLSLPQEYREQVVANFTEDKVNDDLAAINNAWIYTYTGKELHPLSASPDQICIRDIAHALSRMCRFNGHTDLHYSIAQHSISVSQYCDPKDALYGLLHDASEYAISDLVSPIKRTAVFDIYREYERTLQATIYKKFGILENEPKSVKEADLRILSTEALSLLKQPLPKKWILPAEPYPFKVIALTAEEAELLFLYRFRELVSPEQYDKWIKE